MSILLQVMNLMMGQLKMPLLLVTVTLVNGSTLLDHFVEDVILKLRLHSPTIILSEDGESAPDICKYRTGVLCLQNDQVSHSNGISDSPTESNGITTG